MLFYILTDIHGDNLYFKDKEIMSEFIYNVFKVRYSDIHEGIHAAAGGAPFWIAERMMIV